MDYNNLEKRLNDQIHDYESPIDTNDIWNNIEDEIPKKKKNRRFVFWWFFAAMFFAGMLYLISPLIIDSKLKRTASASKQATEIQQPIASKEEKEYCPEDNIQHQQSTVELAQTQPKSPVRKIKKAQRAVKRNAKSNRSMQDETGSNSPSVYINPSTTGSIPWNSTSSHGSSIILPPSSNGSTTIDPTKQATAETKQQLNDELIKGEKEAKAASKGINSSKSDKEKDDKEKADKEKKEKERKDKEKNSKTATKKKPIADKEKTTSKKKKRKRRKWTNGVEFYAGGDIPFKHLKQAGNTGADILSYRKGTEKVLYGYQGGFNYKGFHKKGFTIKTGLQYQQIDEKMEFVSEKQESRNIQVLDSAMINVNNDTVAAVFITQSTLATVVRTKRTYNRYRMLNLPIMVGTRIERKKWQFELAGGLDFNLLYYQKGEIQDKQEAVRVLKYVVNKPSVGVGLLGSVTIHRSIGDNVSIYIEPNIKHMLGSMTPKDYELIQRYTLLGLKTGVYFTF